MHSKPYKHIKDGVLVQYQPWPVGAWVSYAGTKAQIMGYRKNGVLIGYWGVGLQSGEFVRRRVSITNLQTLD